MMPYGITIEHCHCLARAIRRHLDFVGRNNVPWLAWAIRIEEGSIMEEDWRYVRLMHGLRYIEPDAVDTPIEFALYIAAIYLAHGCRWPLDTTDSEQEIDKCLKERYSAT